MASVNVIPASDSSNLNHGSNGDRAKLFGISETRIEDPIDDWTCDCCQFSCNG